MTKWQVQLETTEPGWVQVPDSATTDHDSWTEQMVAGLRGLWEQDWSEGDEEEVRGILAAGIRAREQSPAAVMFLVWPLQRPVAVLCSVLVAPSQDVAAWMAEHEELHLVEATHIGPGVQYAQRHTRKNSAGEEHELMSLAFVFDDGASALVIRTAETLPALLAQLHAGLGGLLATVRMVDSEGTEFRSLSPSDVLADEPWDLETTR